MMIMRSIDYIDHLDAYDKWYKNGESVVVVHPQLPQKQFECLQLQFDNIKDDCIYLHTSGTTGVPKLIEINRERMEWIHQQSLYNMEWNSETRLLNPIPFATTGFWFGVLPAIYHDNILVYNTTLPNIERDIQHFKPNEIIIPTGFVDLCRINNINVDFSCFNKVTVGASQLLDHHVNYLFDNGMEVLNHIYGSTETAVPSLYYKTSSKSKYNCYLELNDHCTMVGDELYFDGMPTGDLFEQEGNLIKFRGRSNDIVTMNGWQCSLLLIENLIEQHIPGLALAIPKRIRGVDYIEVEYTEGNINKDELNSILADYLPKCNIPKKYTKVDHIELNVLHKKVRNYNKANTS